MKPVGAVEAVVNSIKLYVKSYPTLLMPILVVAAFQLLEPVIISYGARFNLESQQVIAAIALMFIPIFFFLLIVGSYISCMVYRVLYLQSQSQGCSIDEMFNFANKRFGTIVLYRLAIFGILLCLGVVIGLLLYVLPGAMVPLIAALSITVVYFSCRLFLSEWLVVHRKLGPIEALQTSYKLTSNRTLRVFISFVLIFIIATILSSIVGLIVSSISGVPFEQMMSKETVGGAKSIYDFMIYLLAGVYYEAFAVNYYVSAKMDGEEAPAQETEHQVDDNMGIQG